MPEAQKLESLTRQDIIEPAWSISEDPYLPDSLEDHDTQPEEMDLSDHSRCN